MTSTPFADYGRDFQLDALRVLFADRDFLITSAGILEPGHFEDKVFATYAEIFIEFAKKYPKDTLTKEVVFAEIKDRIAAKRIEKEEVRTYVEVFGKIFTPALASGYVRDKMRDFVVAKSVEIELVHSVDLLKKGRYQEIVDRITKAHSRAAGKGGVLEDDDLVAGVADRISVYSSPDYLLRKDGLPLVVSGCESKLWRKGVGKKEMIVFCGSPGRGKSICLVNIALMALVRGFNVLFYTLEVSRDIVLGRMDSCLTGIPFFELGLRSAEVAARWAHIQRTIPGLGRLILIDLPPRYLTPLMIKQHLSIYRDRGIEFDMVVPDYADIMASDRHIDERRLEHGDVYENLRGVGKECGVAIATASQANRDSLRRKDVDIDSMAEDFSKAMTADYVVGLSQTKLEAEERLPDGRGTGKMRWFLAKNRNGEKGVGIEMMTNFAAMRVSIEDWERFDIEVYGAPARKLRLAA